MTWTDTTLGQVSSSIQTGPFGSQLHQSDYSEHGTPVVMPKDLSGGRISTTSIARVSNSHVERLSRHKICPGDILYSRRGDVGRCAYASEMEEGWLCGTGCLRVTINQKEADPKFIFYQLQTAKSIGWVEKHAIGATMLNLNTSILSQTPILLPPLHVQKRIGDILSSYDDLIENNRKQIKLLEEAAQRLYKEWFVDLHFPGHENTPITNGIPEGWEKVKLDSLAPIITGKKDANFGTENGKYPFFTCAQEPIKAPTYSFDCNAVILAGNGDFNVKMYRGQFEAYQRTYVFSPKDDRHLFLLYHVVRENMRQLIKAASGSTIKFLTKGMLESISVFIPSDNLLNMFYSNCDAIQKSIECLQQQITYSQEVRDHLLPKLMTGEMEV